METIDTGQVRKKQTRRRSPEEKERRRIEILSLATISLVEGGYSTVKMRDIAKELDTSAASLYSYFENKDEILLAILKEGLADLEKKILEINEEKLLDYMSQLSRIYVDFVEQKPHLYQIMFPIGDEINLSEEGIKRVYKFIREQILGQISQQKGYEFKWNPETFVESYWSFLHGTIVFSTIVDDAKFLIADDMHQHIIEFLNTIL